MNAKVRYQEFLKSDRWKQIKNAKAKSVRKRCAVCASEERIQLHHLFYRWPWTETQTSDTRWLCDECHRTTHELMKSGILTFPKPTNHNSCFTLLKTRVKFSRGITHRNMFAESYEVKVTDN